MLTDVELSCIGCGAVVGDDYRIGRYSVLGYETQDPVCERCLLAAFPKLVEIRAREDELRRKSEAREEARRQLMCQLRDAPNRQEYKRIAKLVDRC